MWAGASFSGVTSGLCHRTQIGVHRRKRGQRLVTSTGETAHTRINIERYNFRSPFDRRNQERAMASLAEPSTRTRVESDSLGQVDLPYHVYWDAQSQRSSLHVNIGSETM